VGDEPSHKISWIPILDRLKGRGSSKALLFPPTLLGVSVSIIHELLRLPRSEMGVGAGGGGEVMLVVGVLGIERADSMSCWRVTNIPAASMDARLAITAAAARAEVVFSP